MINAAIEALVEFTDEFNIVVLSAKDEEFVTTACSTVVIDAAKEALSIKTALAEIDASLDAKEELALENAKSVLVIAADNELLNVSKLVLS